MIYAIRLDAGSIEERLFVCSTEDLHSVCEALKQNPYCADIAVEGPMDFLEVSVPTVTYDPQDLPKND